VRRCLWRQLADERWLEEKRRDVLSKIVRARESFVAQRANVGSFLGVGAHVSKRPVSVYPKTKIVHEPHPRVVQRRNENGGNCGRLPFEMF
jgi:hypothetical protein